VVQVGQQLDLCNWRTSAGLCAWDCCSKDPRSCRRMTAKKKEVVLQVSRSQAFKASFKLVASAKGEILGHLRFCKSNLSPEVSAMGCRLHFRAVTCWCWGLGFGCFHRSKSVFHRSIVQRAFGRREVGRGEFCGTFGTFSCH